MKLGLMPIDGALPFREMHSLALAAERTGFASFWIADHLLYRFKGEEEGLWDALTVLGALSAVTSPIQLGPLVTCTSFRNPALTAKIADTLDEISAGRFILGLGAGWHEPEYTALGYHFDHLASRFEEALQIILPLLRGEKVTFQGEYVQANDAVLLPRGPSPKGPPIWIGAGHPRMLRVTARYADAWNTTWHLKAESVAETYANLLVACQEVGRDPATLDLTAGTYARVLHPGEQPTAEEEGKIIFGTVDSLIEQFQQFADTGVKHLIVIIPGTSVERIEQFAPIVAALEDYGR